MTSSASRAIAEALVAALTPDRPLLLSQWADAYRELDSRSSPEPGRWRTKRTPYLREIMDNLSVLSPVVETVIMKGSQLGFTEVANNLVGYVIHHAPGPGLFLEPSQDLAGRNVRSKIDPMISGAKVLAEKVPAKRAKDGGNTLEEKEFPGGMWLFKWASSTSGLRSSSIRFLVMDEIDEYEVEVGSVDNRQGSPEALARARTNAYGKRKKIYIPSTPTIEGRSRIAALFEDSDQRFYMMPCPLCVKPIRFEFKHLRWEKGQPETVRYECQECGGEIREHQKTQMLEQADAWQIAGSAEYGWVPQKAHVTKRRGYHINGLYSPVGFKGWPEIAEEWETAQGNRALLKTFVNTTLAETWKDSGDAPEWQRLYNRREDYQKNLVPVNGLLLFAGADVQKDRIEVEIKAYGRQLESWSIDYRVFLGDTSDETSPASPWREMDELLAESWPHAHGGVAMQITRLVVDSGYNTQTVYRWAGKHPASRVMVGKGQDALPVAVAAPKSVQIKANGQKVSRGVKLWMIGSSLIKSELYAHLRHEQPMAGEPIPTGYHHFPHYEEEYFRQLCGEVRVERKVKGRVVYGWETTRLRVEVLDCHVYCRAGAAAHGVDRFNGAAWRRIELSLGIGMHYEMPEREPDAPAPAVIAGRQRRKSSYWDRR